MSDDHWFSKFLLKRYVSSDGRLHVFDKVARKRKRAPIKKVCCEEGFTTFTDDQIPPSMKGQGRFFETELSEWERQQSQTVATLVEGCSISKITPDEFWELVRFAVWLHQCNPAIRQMLRKGVDEFHRRKVQLYAGRDLDDLSIKCFGLLLPHAFLKKMLNSAAGQIGLLQSEFLSFALGGAEKAFDLVKEQYAWRLDDFKDSGLFLCTSDRPVLLGGDKLDSYVGFGTPGALFYFPLSPDLCLVGKNMGKGKQDVQMHCKISDPLLAKGYNALVATKSFNLIIASDSVLLPPDGAELPSYVPEIIQLGEMLGIGLR